MLGPLVFDELSKTPLPHGVELFDGGVAGLNLLNLMAGKQRVVLVDALAEGEFGAGARVLRREELAALAGNYGHGAGLPYLAAIAPEVLDPLPEIILVGCETMEIKAIAQICIEKASYGHL